MSSEHSSFLNFGKELDDFANVVDEVFGYLLQFGFVQLQQECRHQIAKAQHQRYHIIFEEIDLIRTLDSHQETVLRFLGGIPVLIPKIVFHMGEIVEYVK